MSDKPLSMPLVTVFFAMLIGAADPLRKLSSVITGVNNGMAAANLLYPILDTKSHLVESPNPKPLPTPHQTDRIPRHHVQLRRRATGAAERESDDQSRRAPGDRRPERRRQEHAHQPAVPVLRSAAGRRADRRRFAPRRGDQRPAQPDRAGDAADRAVQRIDPAQHPLRPLGRHGGGSDRRGEAGPGPRVSSRLSRTATTRSSARTASD